MRAIDDLHPAIRNWFCGRFAAPTPCQIEAWPAILEGRHALIAAPTGSGKTLAAFLAVIDRLVREAEGGGLAEATAVVYVSPLKALGNDIHRNLEAPLLGITSELERLGSPDIAIRSGVRTGDTPASERLRMRRSPPHILVTTPESLYILLTSAGGRAMLETAHTVIVDEVHAVCATKRGAHLTLSLARLDALAGQGLRRIGLSATQRPIDGVARYLCGEAPCHIVDMGHRRAWDLDLVLPQSPLAAVMSNEVWGEVYDRLADLIARHRTTIVFVNTRRMAERIARHLSERLDTSGETPCIAAHHGSLAREHRLCAEARLKEGSLRALVATASLELGIDVGEVDLCCQIGSPRSIATLLQRVGRSGHAIAGLPKGRLFPLSRDDLIECSALLEAARRGELDRLTVPPGAIDVLAQQLVAIVAAEDYEEDRLFDLVRGAHPYRALTRPEFAAIVRILSEGYSGRWGRRAAYLHRDAVNRRLRPRRGARLIAVTSGGAIPEIADYEVREEPGGGFVGTLNEDFAIESMAGDIFQLGNTSWRILRVEQGVVRVEDARGLPPNIPFWLGEAPARSGALSAAVSRLRIGIDSRLARGGPGEARRWLMEEGGIDPAAAGQMAEYLAAARLALGVIPTERTLVIERFFDEAGGMQLVLHAPLGQRLNRALGLALRKRFCTRFNFELQAAATDDAVVLSLSEGHSFPLDEVPSYLNAATVREVLTQALIDAPLFKTRWRWNATISLAVPRRSGARKVRPQLQRILADDLLAAVFPDQAACLENRVARDGKALERYRTNVAGRREIPDHPLVQQTLRDCLSEAMDIEGLERLLGEIARGETWVIARDLTEPSPLAQEILNAKPYAFLDDAPLEERRTRAVVSRRWLDPALAADLGRLDPEAIERVRREAWPEAESADELHDALLTLGFLHEAEAEADEGNWPCLFAELRAAGRATVLTASGLRLWVAVERLPEILALYPEAATETRVRVPEEYARVHWDREAALIELLKARLGVLGPVSAAALMRDLRVPENEVMAALHALEAQGAVLRGSFTGGESGGEIEWCDRRLLARIHRYTVDRLRREIEPVSGADFMRFLFAWQHVSAGSRLSGEAALPAVLGRLMCFEAPPPAWEADLLPARLSDYDPAWLDRFCLSGQGVWRRRMPSPPGEGAPATLRMAPVTLLRRQDLVAWEAITTPAGPVPPLSPAAEAVRAALSAGGALFFDDLLARLRLLPSQLETALAELAGQGLAACDGFAGLRALCARASRRRTREVRAAQMAAAGRWSLTGMRGASAALPGAGTGTGAGLEIEAGAELAARVLLHRYGVVFRRLCTREPWLPPWRELVAVYRRREARGELRGGRFLALAPGEQFALPEAVGLLREVRRRATSQELVSLSAADPLNLVGIVTPGNTVPRGSGRVLYLDGVPIASQSGREVHMSEDLDRGAVWEARKALLRRGVGASRLVVAAEGSTTA
ncbi:MAG: DEAD/DEAH box helicase [Gammaproteobacteria bacterium]